MKSLPSEIYGKINDSMMETKEYTECLIDLPASPRTGGNKILLKIRKKKSLILSLLKGSTDVSYE